VSFRWAVEDPLGEAQNLAEDFESRTEAESWLSESWGSLAQQEISDVLLMEDGRVVYRMSLEPE
jgi:hypothetical protein